MFKNDHKQSSTCKLVGLSNKSEEEIIEQLRQVSITCVSKDYFPEPRTYMVHFPKGIYSILFNGNVNQWLKFDEKMSKVKTLGDMIDLKLAYVELSECTSLDD